MTGTKLIVSLFVSCVAAAGGSVDFSNFGEIGTLEQSAVAWADQLRSPGAVWALKDTRSTRKAEVAKQICRNNFDTQVVICSNNYVGAVKESAVNALGAAVVAIAPLVLGLALCLFIRSSAARCVLGVLSSAVVALLFIAISHSASVIDDQRAYHACVSDAERELKRCLDRAGRLASEQ